LANLSLFQQETAMAYRIALIPGDGIGPEVTAAAQRVVDATGLSVEWLPVIAGQTALDQVGAPLPPATLDVIRNTSATLKGPTATPSGTGFRSVNVEMRQNSSSTPTTARPVRSPAFPRVMKTSI
jgi:isocitrate dehydrogenase (NAD+)